MPTPLGHSLAGFAVHLASGGRAGGRPWLSAAALVFLANAPDLDFLPGYLVGEPRAYHWGPVHSLTAALLAGTVAGLTARLLTGRFLPFFLLGTAAYTTHLLLDVLLGPGPVSVGLQLFWPLTDDRFIAPFAVFNMLPATPDHVGPLRVLFSRAVLPLMNREVAVLAPVCLALWLIGRPRSAPVESRASRPADTQSGEGQSP